MKRLFLTTAMALAAIAPASAADISYNYVELGYLRVDDLSHGITGKASIELGGSGTFATVGGSRQHCRGGTDGYTIAQASLGHALTVADGTDLTAEVAYNRAMVESAGAGSDESIDNFRASLGAAHAFSDRFILSGRVNRYFGGDMEEGDTTVAVGGEVYFNPTWSVLGEIESSEDAGETYLLGLHYGF